MRRRSPTPAFLLTLFAPALVLAGAPAGVDVAALRSHAEFLADDSLRGRDSGSPEYAIAARYAATRFASYGLEPGNGESFFQPVRFAEAQVQKSTVVARRGGRRAELAGLADYLIFGGMTQEKGRVSADVAFVGYGIDAPELDRRDYEGVDVRGKIVLLVKG
ncbi:MAG: peptidase M28, partial [Thermoanaerobaculia bacterium]|nr:peptidase M28 [Thermoanaerobaculia bacterium]